MKKYIVTIWAHHRSDYVPGQGYINCVAYHCEKSIFVAHSVDEIKQYIADYVLVSLQADIDALHIAHEDDREPEDYTISVSSKTDSEDFIEDVYFSVHRAEPCADLLK